MSDTYNGWTNYETWDVALWLGNDEATYKYWRKEAAYALENAVPSYENQTMKEAATCELSRQLKSEIVDGELAPDLGACLEADLLGAALSRVNWYEIAEHMIDEAAEEDDE